MIKKNKKTPIKIIIDILTYILIIIVGLYLLFSIYNKFITKNKTVLIGKYYIFQIATGSMEHELVPGDYIVVEKTKEYKEGDIITYLENGYYITHRINKIDGDLITTKGDANNTLDNPISKDKVIGKYLFKEKILTFLTKYKVIVIATLLALIILESAFKDNNKTNKENKKYKNKDKDDEEIEKIEDDDIEII